MSRKLRSRKLNNFVLYIIIYSMRVLRRHRKKIKLLTYAAFIITFLLVIRVTYVAVFESLGLSIAANELHGRERSIKAKRGRIISSDGTVLATNETVCTVSVVHSQIREPEKIISILSDELEMDENKVRKYVEKISSMERIKTNVDKQTGDRIRSYNLAGVKVDEDSKRIYPYSELASKVLGFTGSDNQGILGLEVEYDKILAGTNGQIISYTDASGVEIEDEGEQRIAPVPGNDLYISLDYNIQTYATQMAGKAYHESQAKSVSIIVMNPQNGEILSMVNYPEYDLNDPFTDGTMEEMNKIWRNGIINDTYEPGSTFKIITATAALASGSVSVNDNFFCNGRIHVGDRFIRCANTRGHGSQSFAQTLQNSCNPAFITWGLRTGKDNMLEYMTRLGLFEKTGIDLPGEAGSIFHKPENIKELDLAVMSFGQSFQITPVQLLRAVSAVVNGGKLITPHFGVKSIDEKGNICPIEYAEKNDIIDNDTSEKMKTFLKTVVEEGGGYNCKIEGYSIAGKTATSEKLPRGNGKYIASFIGIAPADNPQVIAMCIIDEPVGTYYGGMIAAPVVRAVFENILPYLGIEREEIG